MKSIYSYPSKEKWIEAHMSAQAEVQSLMDRHIDLSSIIKCCLSLIDLPQLLRLKQLLPTAIDQRHRGVRQNGKPLKSVQEGVTSHA